MGSGRGREGEKDGCEGGMGIFFTQACTVHLGVIVSKQPSTSVVGRNFFVHFCSLVIIEYTSCARL